LLGLNLQAQTEYKVADLLQEKITVTKLFQPSGFAERGDSTITEYAGGSVKFHIFFLNGDQYHHILNPNPTGVVIGGKEFLFYCGIEMADRTNVSNFLEIYEFAYLNRKYLAFFNFREDCVLKGCRYRCFNLYDITDPKKIFQYSFSSLFGDNSSFGDFNNDGIIDFIRAAPKVPEKIAPEDEATKEDFLIFTAYSLEEGKMKQLKKEGSAYYIWAKGKDEEVSAFTVFQSDWFIPLKDKTGKAIEKVTYFPPYVSFDPKNDFLYDAKGYRVEKNQWVVWVEDYGELDAALDYAEQLGSEKKLDDVFIMIDQYNRELVFKVLLGNYQSKEKAEAYMKKAEAEGLKGKLMNLRKEF
jgi:hypothetical protein